MPETGDWWTAPTENADGQLIMVSGRRDIDKFRNNPRFNIRIEVSWEYGQCMPDDKTSELMGAVTDLLMGAFNNDPVAVMTGIYTGDGRRDWIFYTPSTNIFGRKLNEALAALPLLPLKIYAENDPHWHEYDEMREASEIRASGD